MFKIKTPWGKKTEAEIQHAVAQAKEVERLDRSGDNRMELENHLFVKHDIEREKQRGQSFGLAKYFHQQSHLQIHEDHVVTDLRV